MLSPKAELVVLQHNLQDFWPLQILFEYVFLRLLKSSIMIRVLLKQFVRLWRLSFWHEDTSGPTQNHETLATMNHGSHGWPANPQFASVMPCCFCVPIYIFIAKKNNTILFVWTCCLRIICEIDGVEPHERIILKTYILHAVDLESMPNSGGEGRKVRCVHASRITGSAETHGFPMVWWGHTPNVESDTRLDFHNQCILQWKSMS